MAVRGRKPKPTAELVRLGNPGKRPLNDAEPQPQPASARVPHGLSAGAQKFWRGVAAELVRLGVLTVVDVPAFILMAEHYNVARSAARGLTVNGELRLTYVDEHLQQRKSPLAQVLRDNSSAFRAFATEFGMTPSSRSRLKLAAPDDQDDFMALLFGTDVEVSGDDDDV